MLKDHPKGLYVLFFANMGERFGYYTMLTIFVLYLQENFGWDATKASSIYGAFLTGIYVMPLFGGILADKVLGYGKTIALGTVIMTAGYGLLSIPTDGPMLVYIGLAVISIGNGMFKGNLAVIVGNLYERKEMASLRDSAFNIYYMGINIGAFFSPYAATGIKDYLHDVLGYTTAQGYNAGFAIAGLAMIFSFLVFIIFRGLYRHADYLAHEKKGTEEEIVLTKKQEKDRLVALFIVFGIVIFFWMAFHQNGSTLTMFARDYTVDQVGKYTYLLFNLPSLLSIIAVILGIYFAVKKGSVRTRVISGVIAAAALVYGIIRLNSFTDSNPISAELFQAFNPILIVFMTPVIVGFWAFLDRRGKEPSSPGKIGMGMLIAAVGFAVMILASKGLPNMTQLAGGRSSVVVSPYWLISTYFTLTFAELLLSPIGLSFVSKVAPPGMRGLMQGGWLAATAVGNYLCGFIGRFYQNWELWQFFLLVVASCLVSAVAVALVLKKLKAATE